MALLVTQGTCDVENRDRKTSGRLALDPVAPDRPTVERAAARTESEKHLIRQGANNGSKLGTPEAMETDLAQSHRRPGVG